MSVRLTIVAWMPWRACSTARGRGAFLLRACMEPPWSVRFADGAPLGLVALLHGAASLTTGDGATVHLAPGDVAVLKGTDPLTFADEPATRARS